MNQEDHNVPDAVAEQLPQIEKVIEATITAFKKDGRLIYMGRRNQRTFRRFGCGRMCTNFRC